ncbi:MAG TPA: NAD(P)/FAD-dependent oxidoreductase [Enhygromyxa sp.]|nr:NAD(P)/FAD-dependent oxidoreductase [Enhygromyxa sp.]
MHDYEVCVIGCGPAGFAAAMRCWDFGKKIALIEKGPLGGAGVFNGALSSKTFWELSRDYRNARRLDRGFRAEHVEVDFDAVRSVVDQACEEKARQISRQLDALAEPRPDYPGSIRRYRGLARFLDPHTVHIEGTGAGQSWRVSADHFIIATGSRPRDLPNIEVDGRSIITSDHIGSLDEFPRSLVILGAGVVGCEFATIFANFGRTKVYLIDRAPRILPFEDADIANLCATNLEAQGVTIHRQATLISMRRVPNGMVEYTIEHATGGRETICVEKALISVGRVPNTESLDLDKAGVQLHDRGHIVDEDTRTNVPHIYAVGDVTLDIALVNVGEIEGRHAAERICAGQDCKLSYENLSTIMFLAPEVAAIGLNEQDAQTRRIPYRVGVYDYSLVNRAIAMRATEGFVKLLVSDDDELRILGMRALGTHASTTLEAVSLMIQHGRSARELAELYHPHPAITEGLQDCVRMLLGTSIYKPCVFQSELRLSRIHYADEPG